jgi:two-component system osmolarity sensor histidine kinase EnvZ
MKLVPRTLFGRNVLLMIALIALGQLASGFAFWQYVQRPRVAQLAALTAQYVSAMHVLATSSTPEQLERLRQRINASTRIHMLLAEGPARPYDTPRTPAVRAFLRPFEAALRADPATRDDVVEWHGGGERAIWIGVRGMSVETWLVLSVDRFEIEPSWFWLWLPWLVVAPAVAGAYVIQRRINRPLAQLAQSAEALGRGEHPSPMSEDGPAEIAAVAKSFNGMSAGLERSERERTIMLAGVSHDLRTPLTKMRLAAAMLEGQVDAELLRSVNHSVAEIDATVGQFLDFARAGEGEDAAPGAIDALLLELAAEFAAEGHEFALDIDALPMTRFRPIAMRRVFSNLMRNAVVHARSGYAIAAKMHGERIEVCVLDRGPGIAEGDVERMKRPFVRSESNNARSGTGLGLAIVERIVSLHGGTLALKQRKGGGLEACVRLVGVVCGVA